MKKRENNRYLTQIIQELALNYQKMVFITGPRQSGKTTLCKSFLRKNESQSAYFTWDDSEFRKKWTKHPKQLLYSADQVPLKTVVFDEIHKAPKWKQTVKGIYDTRADNCNPHLFVTGSAHLNTYKKGGDSLMGRYLLFRLHPFSLGELLNPQTQCPPDQLWSHIQAQRELPQIKAQKVLDDLVRYGGFPEPYLSKNDAFARVWRRGRVEKLVHEDLRDLSRIPELGKVDVLTALLPDRIGSPLSITSLKEDLEVSHETTKRWLDYLQALYYYFEIKPWTKNISRSLKKEGKPYLWDWSEISDDKTGEKFENLMACHLLKACHFWTDSGYGTFALHYLRNKEKKEIDFLIVKDKKPWLPIECKYADTHISPSFNSFLHHLGVKQFIQVVYTPHVFSTVKVGDSEGLLLSASYLLSQLP
jgi:predicted AAA+ superfamily ATPase